MDFDNSRQKTRAYRRNAWFFAKKQETLAVSTIRGAFLHLLANERRNCTVWGDRVYLCASRLFSDTVVGNLSPICGEQVGLDFFYVKRQRGRFLPRCPCASPCALFFFGEHSILVAALISTFKAN